MSLRNKMDVNVLCYFTEQVAVIGIFLRSIEVLQVCSLIEHARSAHEGSDIHVHNGFY